MNKKQKNLSFFKKRKIHFLVFPLITLFLGILPFSDIKAPIAGANLGINNAFLLLQEVEQDSLLIQNNALASINNHSNLTLNGVQRVQRVSVVVTAYSSTPWETWGDPYTTAAGTRVRKGIVANNLLPFGTEVRLPEIYGDKVFVVEDRMNSRKGPYHFDIWFPSYWEALNFGVKRTYIEILEN